MNIKNATGKVAQYMGGFFGFLSPADLLNSTFRPSLILQVKFVKMSAFIATASTIIEIYWGVSPKLFVAFLILNGVEWITGVGAALHKGHSFESNKAGRAILKTICYLAILFILNTFKNEPGKGSLWFLFDWSFWAILSTLSIILVRSIFENLHNWGVKEAEMIYGILNNKYTRVLAILVSPPSEEKKNRT